MTPGLLADQPFAARTAAIGADHLGIGPGLIDEHQFFRVEAGLTGFPALACLRHVGPLLLAACRLFFVADGVALEEAAQRRFRRLEPDLLRAPGYDRPSVRSGWARVSYKSQSACGSSGERDLPPRRRGATPPVSSLRLTQRIAEEMPTLNRSAACRRACQPPPPPPRVPQIF